MSDWLAARGFVASGGFGCDEPNYYAQAEVCLNGHTTTDDVVESAARCSKFCAVCGQETIRACPQCKEPIRGYYHVPGVVSLREYAPPNHCHNCGTPYPWTKSRIAAAMDHAAEVEGLNDGEKGQLQEAIEDLTRDGPKTQLAASRFNRLMRKAGQKAGGGLYQFVVDVVSETAKKALTAG